MYRFFFWLGVICLMLGMIAIAQASLYCTQIQDYFGGVAFLVYGIWCIIKATRLQHSPERMW